MTDRSAEATDARLDVSFIDLSAQRARLGDRIDKALAGVLAHGRFILGPEVTRLEEQLCSFAGVDHTISCANGTDALVLAMMALEVGAGDAVLVPSFTFSASAESVVLAGATPVFVDVLEHTFNIDPLGLHAGLEAARDSGLRPRALMSVDLFGQPADYDALAAFCDDNGLVLIDDAAQSFGGAYHGARIGTLAAITTTSFFPSKPFACYGDGGAVFTDDERLAELMRSLRVHGQGANKYDNVRIGMNSRLDSLQAAILIEKLSIFEDEIASRQAVADRYTEGLRDVVVAPTVIEGVASAWALYTIRIRDGRRDDVQRALGEVGVPSVAYYPRPLHRQPAYAHYPVAGDLAVSARLCAEVLSIPMHPYIASGVQDAIIDVIRAQV